MIFKSVSPVWNYSLNSSLKYPTVSSTSSLECLHSFTNLTYLKQSLSQWTWVGANSGSWWWTGKPGVLQSMGSQRAGHDWVTEQNNSTSKVKAHFSVAFQTSVNGSSFQLFKEKNHRSILGSSFFTNSLSSISHPRENPVYLPSEITSSPPPFPAWSKAPSALICITAVAISLFHSLLSTIEPTLDYSTPIQSSQSPSSIQSKRQSC